MKNKFIPAFLFWLLLLPLFSFPSDTINLSNSRYYPAVLKAIQNASKSISVCMYYISYAPGKKGKVDQILKALVDARKRGVKVEIILDRGYGDKGEVDMSMKNIRSYSFLKNAGIPIFYDDIETLTHSKYFIIDEEAVIVGSFNLSENALTSNRESALLVHSKELAKEFQDEFLQIPRFMPEAVKDAIPIPREFFSGRDYLSKMLSGNSNVAVKFVFYAFKKSYEQGSRTIVFTLDEVIRDLFEGKVPNYKRQPISFYMNAYLRNWKKSFPKWILSYREDKEKKELIVELGMENKAEENSLYLSKIFWEDGWNKRLSSRAKWALLYVLFRTESGRMGRYFSEEKYDAVHEFNVDHTIVAYGTGELQRFNLIDKEINFIKGEKNPNGFYLNDFYFYADFEKALEKLKKETDPKIFELAEGLTDSVDEVCDLNVYKRFIELGKKYGPAPLERILKICKERKSGITPFRKFAYVEQAVINQAEGK